MFSHIFIEYMVKGVEVLEIELGGDDAQRLSGITRFNDITTLIFEYKFNRESAVSN